MPEESNYWDKFWHKRLTRRRLISGTAIAGSGLALGAVVGCGGESSPNNNTNGSSSTSAPGLYCGPDATPGEKYLCLPFDTPVDGRKKFTPAPSDSRGGFLTYIGFDAVVLDRYDPHQTQFGPMYSNQSAVFSKLYRYASHEEPTWENILPDLATDAPEMIEENAPLTYIVKLHQGVKFHDTAKIRSNFPKLAGRELTSADVKYSYDRQRNPNSYQKTYYYRSSQYDTIDKLETPDDYTLKITTKQPTAPFYHFMADTNAMIIPPEIVDMGPGPDGKTPWDSVDSYKNRPPVPSDRMIGTGPFMWDSLTFGIEYKAVRNPAWFGWDDASLGRPYLDGYKATGQGLNDATVESLFRRKEIDTAGFIDNPQWILNILDEMPELKFSRQQVSGWLNSRLKLYAKPFDDWRVRRALFLATDRQEIVDIIGSGAWEKVGPVNSAIKYWALPDEELLNLPGYRVGADRDKDIQEARQLFEAAGKPAIPQIWFADVPAYISRYAPTYLQTIKRNLGIDQDIKYQTVPYSRIAEGLVSTDADTGAFTWGYDNGWIDLDDWVYPYFKTGGPKNSFQASDPTLDQMLDKSRSTFDLDERKKIGYDIQRYILGVTNPEAPAAHARIDYACPGGGSIRWPYFKNDSSWPWFGNQYWVSEVWFDKTDPSFADRKGQS